MKVLQKKFLQTKYFSGVGGGLLGGSGPVGL